MKYFITGGVGFIGSNITNYLLNDLNNTITIYDNFSNGKLSFIRNKDSLNLRILKGDILDLPNLIIAMSNCDCVIHLAANADIAASANQTDLDLNQTTIGTFNILESMRKNGVKNLIYSSGSGVYGDIGDFCPDENYGPLFPISLYGATKLSAEALISSFSHLFNFKAKIFRFANVIGPNQTHGVGYDFVNKLRSNPNKLSVLGNGNQSKSYIHVTDVISAIMIVNQLDDSHLSVYNVGTGDYITVRDIAEIVINEMNLNSTKVEFGDTTFGWQGDVPIVRLNDNKIRLLGWQPKFDSKQAMVMSIREMIK